MIWLNPWAWMGLSALAVPVLVHLLARRRAQPLLFPTLRFLGASRPVLARRDRLSDLPLLAVRAAVIAAAVAALAQPHLMTSNREQELGRTLARSVIVDTSASMRRRTPAGALAVDAARQDANRLSQEAAIHRVQETPSPSRDLRGEVAWLAMQPGRRELVVISDFQTGTLTSADIASVPAEMGLRLVRIGTAADATPLKVVSTLGHRETTARVTLAPSATHVEWTVRRTGSDPGSDPTLVLLTDDSDRDLAAATLDAAHGVSPPVSSNQRVAIVFAGFPGRASLIKDAEPLAEPWMFGVLQALRQNQLLANASADVTPAEALMTAPPLTAVVNGADGRLLIGAASDRVDDRKRLLLFSGAGPGSLASAALAAGVLTALAPLDPVTEIDPSTIADDTLKHWERAPGSAAPPRANDITSSDGRWLWVIVLLLLATETWIRRTRRSATTTESQEATHARVA